MNLLKKDEKFAWNEAQDKAFRELLCYARSLYYNTPILSSLL